MATVTQALNNAFGQRQVSTIYNAMNQYRVVMEVAPQFAQGPESLDQVYVVTATGSRVPLSAFSHYTRTSANDRISRNDQFASESVSFELAPGVSLSQAQAAINRAVSVLTLPPRYRDGCRAMPACSRACRATRPSPFSARC